MLVRSIWEVWLPLLNVGEEYAWEVWLPFLNVGEKYVGGLVTFTICW